MCFLLLCFNIRNIVTKECTRFLQIGISHFFILGAISSTTVTRKYIPYSNQVIVLFHGKLFSGWFNANTINTIATINIITPIILDIFFSCNAPSSQTGIYLFSSSSHYLLSLQVSDENCEY